MKVNLKLFSVARDLAGFDERVIEVPAGARPEAVLAYLSQHNPDFERWKSSLRIAVNMRYADRSEFLNEGDEVAVIPPVSGG